MKVYCTIIIPIFMDIFNLIFNTYSEYILILNLIFNTSIYLYLHFKTHKDPYHNILSQYSLTIFLLVIGRTVYFGPVNEALNYFSERGLVCPPFINPADFLLDILDKEEEAEPSGM